MIVSWGGSLGDAVEEGLNEPFAKKKDITVKLESFSGGLAQVRAQVEAGNVTWDVIDSDIPEGENGCAEGILESIRIEDLDPAPDGTSAKDDFLPGTVTECAVGNYIYALVLGYDPKFFSGEVPTTTSDLYDAKRFPGKRGLRKRPRANLEWALIADGVPMACRWTKSTTFCSLRRVSTARSRSWIQSRTTSCGTPPARKRRSFLPTVR